MDSSDGVQDEGADRFDDVDRDGDGSGEEVLPQVGAQGQFVASGEGMARQPVGGRMVHCRRRLAVGRSADSRGP